MSFIDGFVFVVPTENKNAYRDFTAGFAPLFHEYGAEQVVECWGVDMTAQGGPSFPDLMTCGPDETVCFSWIRWPDRASRDAAMEKMMADKRFDPANMDMPFEITRITTGGFEPVVDSSA